MATNNIVKEISEATNKKIVNQTLEYLRLLKIKTSFKTKNEHPRIVMCLDISATKANETIDFDKGLKLINYGKVKYRNEKNTILRILDQGQAPNIKSICIALELTLIKDFEKKATQILQKLKKCKANLLGEIGHPQNACMAVYQSCKLLAVKVDERKLINLSRLQRKQWTQLKTLWCPWLAVPTTKDAKQNAKAAAHAGTNGQQVCPLRVIETVAIESYDVWKRRILQKARADLALLKKKTRRYGRNTKK